MNHWNSTDAGYKLEKEREKISQTDFTCFRMRCDPLCIHRLLLFLPLVEIEPATFRLVAPTRAPFKGGL
jgi:hypothetical protein